MGALCVAIIVIIGKGQRHGKGEYLLPNGCCYTGDWREVATAKTATATTTTTVIIIKIITTVIITTTTTMTIITTRDKDMGREYSNGREGQVICLIIIIIIIIIINNNKQKQQQSI